MQNKSLERIFNRMLTSEEDVKYCVSKNHTVAKETFWLFVKWLTDHPQLRLTMWPGQHVTQNPVDLSVWYRDKVYRFIGSSLFEDLTFRAGRRGCRYFLENGVMAELGYVDFPNTVIDDGNRIDERVLDFTKW